MYALIVGNEILKLDIADVPLSYEGRLVRQINTPPPEVVWPYIAIDVGYKVVGDPQVVEQQWEVRERKAEERKRISDWEFACLRPGDRVEQRFLVGRFVGGEAHYAEEMRVREVGFRDDGWPELKAVPNHFYNIGKRSIR